MNSEIEKQQSPVELAEKNEINKEEKTGVVKKVLGN
jgi:hypothetical protein